MASQRLIIAKIAGAAATYTLELFTRWSGGREGCGSTGWFPRLWPESVREEADDWAASLRENGHKPPVVFFAEYVDLWSYSPPDRYFGEHGLIQVLSNRYELYCIQLPLSASAQTEIHNVRVNGQWSEDRLFGIMIEEAVAAWNELVKDDPAVLVFIRRITAGAAEDHEITASLAGTPPWLLVS